MSSVWSRLPEWAHLVLYGAGAFIVVMLSYLLWIWASE